MSQQDKLPSALIEAQDPNTIGSLRALADLISQNGITLKPGKGFGYNRAQKCVTYDPTVISKMPGYLAAGLMYHNVGHAIHSVTESPLPKKAVDIATSLATPQEESFSAAFEAGLVGKTYETKLKVKISPASVYSMIEAAEDERMESRMRDEYKNLGATYLPRLDQGYRERAYLNTYKVMQTPDVNTTEDNRHFWHRATIAVRGLVSGAMGAEDLPSDMSWSDETIAAIKDLRNAPSVDDLVAGMEEVLGKIIYDQEENSETPGCEGEQQEENSETPGCEGEEQGCEGEEQEEPPDKSDAENKSKNESKGGQGEPSETKSKDGDGDTQDGQGSSKGDSAEKPRTDKCKLDREPLESKTEEEQKAWEERLKEIKESAKPQEAHKCTSGTCAGDGTQMEENMMTTGSIAKWLAEAMKSENTVTVSIGHSPSNSSAYDLNTGLPDWESVRITCEEMLRPVNRAVKQRLRDNETQDISSGFKAGARLNGRSLARQELNKDGRIFRKYASTGEKSYGVYLLYDISGSMSSHVSESPTFPSVYGHYDQQECTSQLRMAVSVIEALRHFKEVQVGIGAYHSVCLPLKEVSMPLTSAIQEKIIGRLLSPTGGNEDHLGLRMARVSLEKIRADKKIIILMTDGGFCVEPSQMIEEYNLSKKSGIDTSVLVVNHGEDHLHMAKEHYPGLEHIVDQCYENDLGNVLGKVLGRMIKVREQSF